MQSIFTLLPPCIYFVRKKIWALFGVSQGKRGKIFHSASPKYSLVQVPWTEELFSILLTEVAIISNCFASDLKGEDF